MLDTLSYIVSRLRRKLQARRDCVDGMKIKAEYFSSAIFFESRPLRADPLYVRFFSSAVNGGLFVGNSRGRRVKQNALRIEKDSGIQKDRVKNVISRDALSLKGIFILSRDRNALS